MKTLIVSATTGDYRPWQPFRKLDLVLLVPGRGQFDVEAPLESV